MMKFVTLIALCISIHSFGQVPLLKEWTGHYEGTLYLEFPDKTLDSVQMTFDFLPTKDPFVWKQVFQYKSEKYGNSTKDYVLKYDEAYLDGRHFVLDEQNGILIDEVFMNNTFYAHYEVLKNFYNTILRKEGDHLYYEIVCSKNKGGRFTKSERDEEGNIYEVTSSLTYTIQYAKLFCQSK